MESFESKIELEKALKSSIVEAERKEDSDVKSRA